MASGMLQGFLPQAIAPGMKTSQKIDQTLGQRDLRPAWLARASGLSEATISRIRHGAEPSLSQASAIARALGVSLEWLASEGEKEPEIVLTVPERMLVHAMRRHGVPPDRVLDCVISQISEKSPGRVAAVQDNPSRLGTPDGRDEPDRLDAPRHPLRRS